MLMCTPRARAQTSASGDSGAPTVSSAAPRRAASAASASGPGRAARLRDRDDEVERPDPAGQRQVAPGADRHGRAGLGQQLEHVAHDGRPAQRRHQHRAGPLAPGHPLDPRLLGEGQGLADLGPGRGQRPQRAPGVEAGDGLLVVDAVLVEEGCHGGCRSGRLAGLVDEQDGHAVVDAVGQPHTPRWCTAAPARSAPARQRARCGMRDSAGSRAATARSAGWQPSSVSRASPLTRASEHSSRTRSIVARSAASTLSRSSGSVLDARRLSHHIGSPSPPAWVSGEPVELVGARRPAAAPRRAPARWRPAASVTVS